MSRYIDADKLILSLRECAGYEHNKHTTTTWIDACEAFIDEIEDMLVDNKEDVAPIIHAHWIEREYDECDIGQDCSHCKRAGDYQYAYCPHCGAKMDADRNEYKEEE